MEKTKMRILCGTILVVAALATRGAAHNDDRGKQLIAQTLAAYFRSVALGKDCHGGMPQE